MARGSAIAVFLVVLWTTGCETKRESPSPFHVYSTVDTANATVGDVIHFQVWAKGAGQRVIQFPDPVVEDPDISIGGGAELKSEFRDDYGVEFEIAFWDTGKFTFPAYSVHVMSAEEDTVEYSMVTNPITVTVQTVITSPQPTLRDVKPPVPIPIVFPVRVMATVGAVVLLLGVMVWLWKKRVSGARPAQRRYVPSRPPYEIAREKLDALRERGVSTAVEVKHFYVELSYIVREFLEYQYFVRAIEMTTEEIDGARALFPVDDDHWNLLMGVLKRADLAKFARLQPQRKVCLDDLETMEEFVESGRIEWSSPPERKDKLEAV